MCSSIFSPVQEFSKTLYGAGEFLCFSQMIRSQKFSFKTLFCGVDLNITVSKKRIGRLLMIIKYMIKGWLKFAVRFNLTLVLQLSDQMMDSSFLLSSYNFLNFFS